MNTICPVCQTPHDCEAAIANKATPTNGDLSICIDCGHASKYDADAPGLLVALTHEELTEAMAVPQVKLALAAVRKMLAERVQ